MATDLYTAYGVEQGRECVFVDAGGHCGEFEIKSDADLQIDLYEDGYTREQIRLVMADVRYSRSVGCRALFRQRDDIPCAQERAHPQERPADSDDEHGSKPAAFTCHGARLLRSNSRLKWTVCFLAWVAAYLAWRNL